MIRRSFQIYQQSCNALPFPPPSQVCGDSVSFRPVIDSSLFPRSRASHLSSRVAMGSNRAADGALVSLATLRRQILPNFPQFAGVFTESSV